MSKLKIKRILTANLKDPYENIKFKTVKSTIRNFDGSAVSVSNEIIVPAHWSDIAVDILARNYFRKKGVPKHLKKVSEKGIPDWLSRSVQDDQKPVIDKQENDAKQVFDRLVGAWTYWGVKGNYFDSEADAKNFFDEMRYMLAMQMGAPNSPQWFNTGVHWAYGVTGSAQGHYYFDELEQCLKKSQSSYERPQPHACFIQSVKDDLVNEGGIMDLWVNEARLFKYGSGTGSNFSKIRGSGEQLAGGGYSSGLMSFLKIGDVSGGSIKSGGTTRRAAKMVILDIDHPDIESFITWKMHEENKVMDLVVGSKIIKTYTQSIIENYENKKNLKKIISENADMIPQSYTLRVLGLLKDGVTIDKEEITLDWNSGAYTSVFGQNSNNSVRVNDSFLHSVENDEDFNLIRRTDGAISKTVKSKYLWDLIAQAAWACADPGMQFDTTINAWNTCANDDRINGSNPCSEYMFLDDTACNLASLNLCLFLKNSKFDINLFKHAIRLWTIVLEISVYMAQFPTAIIAQKSYEYRTLGLGYGNLGALLMQLGVPYDSDLGRNTAAGITALMQGVSYATSCELAKYMGAFVRFEANKEPMMKVMRNHARAALNSQGYEGLAINPIGFEKKLCFIENLDDEIQQIWKKVLEEGEIFGFRNAQVSVIAPTGTIGLVMDFKTTGIEPQFSQLAIKQLAGGGVFKMVNSDIDKALRFLNYKQEEIDAIQKHVVGNGKLSSDLKINEKWLAQKGFLEEEIKKIQQALEKAFNILQAFTVHVLGKECFERLNIPKTEYQKADFNLLKKLGATDSEIQKADFYCCGNMTLEGAPYLKPEHLSIFDCALPGGNGVRYLSYQSHIKMMAAIQPFISGAISKTINLPYEACKKDFEDAYMMSWKLGLKAVAIYRDGSKYSQVLSTNSKHSLDSYLMDDDLDIEKEIQKDPVLEQQINIPANSPIKKEDFFKPFRRRGYTQHVLIGSSSLWHTTGEDEDGKLRNILLSYGKEGSTLRGWAGAWGRIFSMYLQEKGDAALLRVYKAFKHSKFEPMGKVDGHSYINHASSIPDYIVEDLVGAYPDMLNCELEPSKLPPERKGRINKVKIGQEVMYIIIGEDTKGAPCEIFVAGVGNEGSDLRGWMNSCAKLISLYLQDCPETAAWNFINAFEGSSFDPSGFIEGHKHIKLASSPLDFLAKHLKYYYGNVLNNEQTTLPIAEEEAPVLFDVNVDEKINLMSGYKVDEPCKTCKAFKLRYNGTCYICDNCFTTTGCS